MHLLKFLDSCLVRYHAATIHPGELFEFITVCFFLYCFLSVVVVEVVVVAVLTAAFVANTNRCSNSDGDSGYGGSSNTTNSCSVACYSVCYFFPCCYFCHY